MRKFHKKTALCLALGLWSCCSFGLADSLHVAWAAPVTQGSQQGSISGIQSVQTISFVYGDGEKPAAVVLEYPSILAADKLSPADFSISGKKIQAVYTNAKPEYTTENVPGRYVILCLEQKNTVSDQPMGQPAMKNRSTPSGTGDAPRNSNRQMPDLALRVAQTGLVKSVDGTIYPPRQQSLLSTESLEPSLAGFQFHEYTDPKIGCTIPYYLYLPEHYDAKKKYPLLFFVADASANVENPKMVLVQGNGAVVWADSVEQEKHPCIILAPAYTHALVDSLGMLTEDSNTWTKGLTLVSDLLFDVTDRYAVDKDRIYGTGQSQGGMTNIAISDKYPSFFAAQYLVACQWNPIEMEVLKDKNLWIMVSQGDTKAYPGMNEAVCRWENLGSRVAKSDFWDSKASAAVFAARVHQMEAQGANINYSVFAGGNHMYTWSVAYNIAGIHDWLFAQKRSAQSAPAVSHGILSRASLTKGVTAYQEGRYTAALSYLHLADRLGDFKAARYIGLCYEKGQGVLKDLPQAVQWYRRAADAGDITGTYYLGRCYENGLGVQQDYSRAIQLYLKSAQRGDIIAAPGLVAAGHLLENGLGTAKDSAKAMAYYEQAAKTGFQPAEAALLRMKSL